MDDKLVWLSDVTGLLRKIEKLYHETYVSNVRADMVAHCIDRIKTIPAVDAVQVRHGEWLRTPTSWVYCSVCGDEPPQETNVTSDFCPNCGARMDRKEDHNAPD